VLLVYVVVDEDEEVLEVAVDELPRVNVPLKPVSAEVLVTIEPDDLRLLAVIASIICTSETLAPLTNISSFSHLISNKLPNVCAPALGTMTNVATSGNN
jgi:hypothetical protein